MAAPVAWMGVAGTAIVVDLAPSAGGPLAVREARQRIARKLGKPVNLVRLLDPAANALAGRVLRDGGIV